MKILSTTKKNNFIPLKNSSNQSVMGAPMRERKRNHIYGDIKQETKSNVRLFSLFQRKKGYGRVGYMEPTHGDYIKKN
jgi:hypothetical protein